MLRHRAARLFERLSAASELNLADTLRTENAGGALLLLGALIALGWANSPGRDAYQSMRAVTVGPAGLHLQLTLGGWASDGLLAIFFFVVGLELKREIVSGELRRPATAVVPIVAAIGGMVAPALLYLAVSSAGTAGEPRGWAIPTATDIAFAVAVLSLVGRRLPNALRAFLLTLAVVDDLLAIVIIAVFYSASIRLAWVGAALVAVALFALLTRRGVASFWVLAPIGLAAWAFMHASGVHATIAGVLLGLSVPAVAPHGSGTSLAERFEHRWRPVSAGVAVPVFALFAAGVPMNPGALADAIGDPAARGVAVGLVIGKPLGIVVTTFLVARFTRASLSPDLTWWDVLAVAALGGIGFTVSLLIGDLAFGAGSARDDHVKAAVLLASGLAAMLGAGLLSWRGRRRSHPREAGRPPGRADQLGAGRGGRLRRRVTCRVRNG
jgi:NhaA family Na+:H+ antiporter